MRLLAGHRARPRHGAAERLRAQAPAGPHRAAGPEDPLPRAAGEAGRRERLRQEERKPAAPLLDDDRPVGDGGGDAARRRRPAVRARSRRWPRPATPTPGPRRRWSTTARRRTASRKSRRSTLVGSRGPRARRRADRRDHLLHEHVQPERHARGRASSRRRRSSAGSHVSPRVKASLAPGSRVVTEYLARTGLQPYLDQLGFNLVGYGCTTCIGNSGPLDPRHRGGRHAATTSSPRASSPATATSRRASSRTSRRIS